MSVALVLLSAYYSKGDQVPPGGQNIILDALSNYSTVGGNEIGSIEILDVDHSAFSKAFKVEVKNIPANSYNFQLKFKPHREFKKDDVYLLSFWARCTVSSSEAGDGLLTAIIEHSRTYDKVLDYSASPGAEWRHFLYGFEGSNDLALENLNVAMFLGHGIQTIEIADIQVLSYGTSLKLEDLPVIEIYYNGKEEDAPWRVEANERIARFRKGALNLILENGGAAVSGAEVTIAMKKHKFSFGSAIDGSLYLENKKYRDTFHSLFNEAVFENDLKWPNWVWKKDHSYIKSVLDSLDKRNTSARGHNAIWPGWQFLPDFVEDLKYDPAALKKACEDHIDEVIGFTRGRMADWDIMNEPRVNHDIQDILGDEVMADWFIRAKRLDPTMKCYINDYGILTNGGFQQNYQDTYYNTIEYIENIGGAVDGIGIQGHFAEAVTGIPRVLTILDRFSNLGKEIKITEFDVNSTNDELKSSYTRDFLTALFSHPYVGGVLSWGFWAGRHWRPEAAYIDEQWNLNANGKMFEKLVHEDWWTAAQTGQTAADGRLNFGDVFLGQYEITISNGGEKTVITTDIHFNDINIITIDLSTNTVKSAIGENHPETPVFTIAAPNEPEIITSAHEQTYFADSGIKIFPNPSGGRIHVRSDEAELARVSIRDLSGRCMYDTKACGSTYEGETNLRQGVYLLTVQTEDKIHECKIVIN
ncbi:MAG: T9SS type A sorting domain-containing protein [Cyclobacteriaceae bacterium]|nr:T9SS type A sorting domain-containing protein [Cyclobacteriaceae bacterium]